jgi:ankyrin repeat protein
LGAGAEVYHANNEGLTALYEAAQEGHVEAMKVLLEARAEVDRTDNKGYSAGLRAGGCHRVTYPG